MRIVLLLLLLFALPEPLRSEALPQWKAALLFGEPDASSQEIRREIARELRTKVKALLAFLPNLKPSQVLWLAAEREAMKKLDKIGSGEPFVTKAKQIMSSPDFKLETLRNALSTLETSMNCVLQANVRVRREWPYIASDPSPRPPPTRFHSPTRQPPLAGTPREAKTLPDPGTSDRGSARNIPHLGPTDRVIDNPQVPSVLYRLLKRAFEIPIRLWDLMMPHMTGMEFHGELIQKSPEQAERTIFFTGGAFTRAARQFLDEVSNQRLEKPFNREQLRALVNERVRHPAMPA